MNRRRRQARTALWSGLLAFALAHVGVVVALDTFRPELLDPEYGHRVKRLAALPTPVVVVFGSSRTEMGLAAGDLSDERQTVFNFGMAGCGPVGELLALNRVLEAGFRPDRVVVELLPPAMHADGPIEGFVQMRRLAWADLSILAAYSTRPRDLYAGWFGRRLGGWYMVRQTLLSHLSPRMLPWRERLDYMWNTLDRFGWLAYPHATISEAQRATGFAQAKAQYENILTNYRLSPVPTQAVEQIIAVCRDRGIPLAFHVMPESKDFRNLYGAAGETFNEYLTALRSRGIAVVDCRDWIDDEDFADGHHLLPAGAHRFTARFGEHLNPPPQE